MSGNGNPDIWREMALLGALEGDAESLQMYKLLTGLSIGQQVFRELSGQAQIDALRSQVVVNIADYVKKHPKAGEDELAKVVQTEIAEFTKALEKL